MDIRFLTTFIEVVNTRHFGKAAENLYLTQSAVSARIKLLEEYFHTSLFERHRNSIQLTQAGEKLLPYAQQLCDTLKQAKRELQAQTAEYVVLGVTQLACDLRLADILRFLHSDFSDWSVKAEVLTLDNLTRQLHERVVDFALSTEPLKTEDVICHQIASIPLGLFNLNDTTAPTSGDFIAIDWGSKAHESLLHSHADLRDAKLQTNSLNIAISTLASEGGVAVLPMHPNERSIHFPKAKLQTKLEGVSVTLYLSMLKTSKREGLPTMFSAIKDWTNTVQ
ncbi:LysR family transcriptional regulator [Alteromonas sp. ASW11-130]|uniref:LysR family transcriptional regulator n=1 Tax=Alteromonas sp. ASW11-130 TaxID=3015775 RepID=UPI002242AEE4|nr:LysR family transcriptional regulator [Alteromonas sp. ASW11-130]MCW8090268.1 LysR family transcriptional regulator [Alteromonas sp. ASW11-130]